MPGWGPAPKSLWRPLGPPGSARGTRAAAAWGDRLLLTRDDGSLRAVEPRSGRTTPVATQGFAAVEMLHATPDGLVAIEEGGRLTAVEPLTGALRPLGQLPAPTRFPASTVHGGALYVVATSGQLYQVGLGRAAATGLGRPDFEELAELFSVGGRLVGLDVDGGLHELDPATGEARKVKQGGGEALAGAALGNALILFTKTGLMLRTQPPGYEARQVGGADYAGTRLAVAVDGAVITIEEDGSLYRVEPR